MLINADLILRHSLSAKHIWDSVDKKRVCPTAAESCTSWDCVRMLIMSQNVIGIQCRGLMACVIRPLHEIPSCGSCWVLTSGKYRLYGTTASSANVQGDQNGRVIMIDSDTGFSNSLRPPAINLTTIVCAENSFYTEYT